MKYQVTVAGRSFEIEVDHERLVRVNGQPMYVDLEQVGGLPVYSLTLDDSAYVVCVEEHRNGHSVEVRGQVQPVRVELKRPHLTPAQDSCPEDNACLTIEAPLAGTLVSLPVAPGDEVSAGQVVAVVESMKMEMRLRTPLAGEVLAAHGPDRRKVSKGEQLVQLTFPTPP
jgi:biotin carboxyl carrier protein